MSKEPLLFGEYNVYDREKLLLVGRAQILAKKPLFAVKSTRTFIHRTTVLKYFPYDRLKFKRGNLLFKFQTFK